MRLTKAQAEQLRRDLQRSPLSLGYEQPRWTASCLSRHLETRYGVIYAPRHCRRLILWGKSGGDVVAEQLVKEPVPETKLVRSASFSEEYRHRKSLHRLRQLASSRLQLKQFGEALFEQLAIATSSGEAMQFFGIDDPKELKLIFRDQETVEWNAANRQALKLVNSDDEALSGMSIKYSQLQSIKEPVLPTDWLMGPRFHESPAYHEVWKHHRVYSGVMNFFRDNGRYIGLAPIWKTRKERPFTSGDVSFLRRAVPLITHGLVVAQTIGASPTTISETQPSGGPLGIVTTDSRGKVLAMDRTARSLFSQPAILDGKPMDAFATSNLREGLRYVAAVLRQAFGGFNSASDAQPTVPAARVWWHGAGTVLLLKATLGDRVSGSPFVTILVEERELVSAKHKRLALKHGMSARESQVFHLANAGTPRKEIAYQLGLSVNTVRTYIKQIAQKGVPIGSAIPTDFNIGSIWHGLGSRGDRLRQA